MNHLSGSLPQDWREFPNTEYMYVSLETSQLITPCYALHVDLYEWSIIIMLN